MISDQFEALREMDKFTEDMFNRIIAFQEKQHPAWNPKLSFDERINDLPLHYLIFSNADRDPENYAATVASYYPLRWEMQTIAYYINAVSSNATTCDLYSGNGFIGSLLAREGVNIVGLRPYNQKPNQITDFSDGHCYQFSEKSLQDCECDAVFISWPPSGENPTPMVLAKKPKVIIYVYTQHQNERTGERQTGDAKMFDGITDDYELVDEWSIVRPENLLHEIWPDLTPNIEETRITRVYIQKPFATLSKPAHLPDAEAYQWEQELNMAQLALQAKQQLRSQGITV